MLISQNNLTIRNATAEDAAILGKWWRDGKVMAHAGFPNGISITDEEIAERLAADSDETHRRLIIEVDGIAAGEMNYSKIILDTNLNNLRAQHVYEKLGFCKIAVNHDSWKNQLGELQSSVDYELTKDEWY